MKRNILIRKKILVCIFIFFQEEKTSYAVFLPAGGNPKQPAKHCKTHQGHTLLFHRITFRKQAQCDGSAPPSWLRLLKYHFFFFFRFPPKN